ncbi:hypothetical protein L1987_19972 [Smallanthus sonchifolius]|uniref:Uncharacterized protein n=1 Tax=Smallanthus sonchifolius TaxID=185202 RepID=A0ACB9IQS4_9ASTR|nr:hypothetical protein L1987_19972 [Smallanthus sonchifolius]
MFIAFLRNRSVDKFQVPSIKHSATVQAYFRLQKPVSYLLPQISRLEYDIYSEIGVPDTQVAILSMHKASASNWTHVVFGVLPNPMNSSINPMSLSVLRPSFLDLFNQRSNLTLTPSIFGQPSSFDILKFPGGITVIPKQQSASIWMLRQARFNFTLPNSVREIEENFGELKEQLKSGLHLKSYESVHMQVTNKAGSTRDPPVTVQASIMSDLGNLVPPRLKQLAQTITGSHSATNLGLDHSFYEFKASPCSEEFTSALHEEEPVYDEDVTEPDEEECVFVRRLLNGITSQDGETEIVPCSCMTQGKSSQNGQVAGPKIVTVGSSFVSSGPPQNDTEPPKVDTSVEVIHEQVTTQISKDGDGEKGIFAVLEINCSQARPRPSCSHDVVSSSTQHIPVYIQPPCSHFFIFSSLLFQSHNLGSIILLYTCDTPNYIVCRSSDTHTQKHTLIHIVHEPKGQSQTVAGPYLFHVVRNNSRRESFLKMAASREALRVHVITTKGVTYG